MGEHYRFFDSIDGKDERVYSADEFAEYFRQLLTSGVLNGDTNLEVQGNGSDMTVSIQPGYAWLEGYLYKVDEEPLPVQVDAADPTLSRIDRVVIRLDKRLDHRYVKAFLLKGEPAEEPLPPNLTRGENIFEISLAQIHVVAGKSFIDETGISDERFDETVCGLVNSLIKVDTQHLIDRFEATWGEWFHGIRQDTFVPLKNLQEGFLKTEDEEILSVPNAVLQIEEGWPHQKNRSLQGLGFDEQDRLEIQAFQKDGNLFKMDVTEATANTYGENLSSERWLAIPFRINEDTDYIELALFLGRSKDYFPSPQLYIYECDSAGNPDLTKEIGYSPFSGTYAYNGGRVSMKVQTTEPLVRSSSYAVVLRTSSTGTYAYILARYKNTPGKRNYFLSTNQGSSWTAYERTPFLEVNGLVREGTAVFRYPAKQQFKDRNARYHLSFSVGLKEAMDSSIVMNLYSEEGQLIKENIQSEEKLLDIPAEQYPGLSLRLTLNRAGMERPKLSNFSYTWIKDISKDEGGHAVIPSSEIVQEMLNERATSSIELTLIQSFQVSRGGRYRFTAELKSSPYYSSFLEVHLNQLGGTRLGYYSIKSDEFRSFQLDLDSVPPNSNLIIALRRENGNAETARIRNMKICGSLGYQYD